MPPFDHFRFLAPIYRYLVPAPKPDDLQRALKLPISGALLDVGGGTGRVTAQFIDQVGLIVIADPSTAMLRQAESQPRLHRVATPAERLPFADAVFERIVIVDALHHFADVQHALHELIRVLAPEGRLLIQEPDWRKWSMRLVSWGERLALMQPRPYAPETIVQMVRRAGGRARCLTSGGHTAWIVTDKSVTDKAAAGKAQATDVADNGVADNDVADNGVTDRSAETCSHE
jgi:SAM-dependent methyltransferase